MRSDRRSAFLLLLAGALPAAASYADNESAVHWSASYTGDAWKIIDDGEARRSAWLDLLEVGVAIDGAQVGAPGWSASVTVHRDNGGSISRYVGDSAGLDNIEATGVTRLHEAWLEWHPAQRQETSFKFGLVDLNSEFDVSDVGSTFVNSTFGLGVDLAQSGVTGPSAYPLTALAVRGRWQPNDLWRVHAALFDGVPGKRSDPVRPTLQVSTRDGALRIVELQYNRAAWRAYVGHWRYSAALPVVGQDVDPELRDARGSAGSYALVEAPLWLANDARALHASVRYGVASARHNPLDRTLQFALRFERPWLGLEGEALGMAWAVARFGDPARRAARLDGVNLERYEHVLELTYRIPIGGRWVLQPDLQYVAYPGGVASPSRALVAGLRFELDLSP